MYEPRVLADIRQVRQEAAEPELLDRLMRVVDEQRGHTLAMEVEDAKIALSEKRRADIPLEWVAPGLSADISRPDLVSHTRQLADRIAARIKNCLAQAGAARRHRRRVPDRRLGETRPCAQGHHQGRAVGPYRRRRHFRRGRQGTDA